MKRDLDLVRLVLLALEADESGRGFPRVQGYAETDVRYHLDLLRDAGLVANESVRSSMLMIEQYRLTWQGHEFLDASRDDQRWGKAKRTIANIGGASFEILKGVLIRLIAEQLKSGGSPA